MFLAAIFDVDGVLVDSPHQKAWRESLRQLMESDWAGIRDRTIWSLEVLRPGMSLLDYFDADLSGRDLARGKPDPGIFLTAAHELGVEPSHTMVLEDATAGADLVVSM